MSADWAAAVSLGILSHSQGDSKAGSLDPHNVIAAFWAPFLLLHLGGPDTITAYSLEDNELWLRHLLGLGVQVGVAFYVCLRSWTSTHLVFKFLAIPVFVAGIIKYGERTWVLRTASNEHFGDSILQAPDPGPDYEKLVKEYSSGNVELGKRIEPVGVSKPRNVIPDATYLHGAYCLFKILRRLYSGLILSYKEEEESYSIIRHKSPIEAFKLVEVELGFLYDVLYTKATVVYSHLGIILRSISFMRSILALVAFWLLIDKHPYSKIYITIIYLLLVGAILIEIYAVFLLLFSDLAMLWFAKREKQWTNFMYRAISSSRLVLTNDKRWSGSMAQYNLIGFCLKDKPTKCHAIQKFIGIYEMLVKYQYKTWNDVNMELKDLIFQQLKEKHDRLESSSVKQICSERGNFVLERKYCLDAFGWSIVEVEFGHSLLLWHIATDLCYYSDINNNEVPNLASKYKVGKSLSDYMLYLLVMCPFMLPKGIEQIRYRDTCAEAMRFFQQKREKFTLSSRNEACMLLLGVNTNFRPEEVKGDRSKSVLFDGCRLAKLLQSVEHEEKWEMISNVWVEMLCNVASHCEWNHHAQQLRRGGELLTHVRILMEHLGLSEQFQIKVGYTRAIFL